MFKNLTLRNTVRLHLERTRLSEVPYIGQIIENCSRLPDIYQAECSCLVHEKYDILARRAYSASEMMTNWRSKAC